MIVVARRDAYPDLDAFAAPTAIAAPSGWRTGRLSADGTTFADETRSVTYADGASGRERIRALSVSVIGMFSAGYRDGWQIAFQHPKGLWIQVWIFERSGGLREARRLAEGIASSYRA